MKTKLLTITILTLTLCNCSTIIEGRTQAITVNTTPSGSKCNFIRDGKVIGIVNSTSGTVVVDKTRKDIKIVCSKAGYNTGSTVNKSGLAGATFGNAVAGWGIGVGVDLATGAANKYDSEVNIKLSKKEQ